MPIPEIKKVGVVGAGTMGQGIAIACALAGYETLLFDSNAPILNKSFEVIRQMLQHMVAKGKLNEESYDQTINRIKPVVRLADLKADLIVEAVVENLEVKRNLFSELEKINSGVAILASNTSSISISETASFLNNPAQCVGLHFFNPAHLMKLVEVISGSKSDNKVLSLMKDFSTSLGKVPVEVKDSPGFIVNRVARHFYVESLKILEDKVTSFETIDKLMRSAGFKMGPFELMDLIGIDVNYAVTTSVYEGFGRAIKFKPSAIQYEKIRAGQFGRKTGKGFYDYSKK